MKTLTTLFLILIGFIGLQAQTVISGGNVFGEWKTENSPFLIEGDIYLDPEDRLIIRQGVEVIFQDYYSFDIAGRIEILGTETDSIIFTVQDTTGYYLGDHTGWNGLILNGLYSSFEENSLIKYCCVEYSQISGITCINYPQLEISNCNVRFNQTTGIALHEYSDIVINDLYVNNNLGGGIACNNSAPIVTNFNIEDNQSSGIKIYGHSMSGMIPFFLNGKIQNNHTTNNGGGICMWDAGIQGENIEILSNSATKGGGVYCNMSIGMLKNVIIGENVADNGGGIQSEYMTEMTFEHVLISDNHANACGGGAFVTESSVEFINATISNNTALSGGGVFYDLYPYNENEIMNSIIWSNQPDEIFSAYEAPFITYSNIALEIEGVGNINEDPLFIDPEHKNYYLQWSNFPSENGDKSPCIDAGDPGSTVDPDGTITDMGAFYYDQVIFTAINDNNSFDNMNVFPNPIVNEVQISGAEDIIKIQVVNLMGKVVFEKDTNGLNTEIIDLSFLKSGVHIMNFYDTQGSIETKKIIKK